MRILARIKLNDLASTFNSLGILTFVIQNKLENNKVVNILIVTFSTCIHAITKNVYHLATST